MINADEVLRLVDTIHRSREIEKETIFQGVEMALVSAIKKKFGDTEDARVQIDRRTGETVAYVGPREIDVEELGRLAAMNGKQVLMQKIREAERDRVYEEFEDKVRTIVVGVVQRFEGPNMLVNLGKVDGFLPRSEQVPGEKFKTGDRIKVVVKDLKKNANRVKITLSRGSPEIVRNLFELEVPEIMEKVIEVKEIAREPGYRTKIAVTTYDTNVDCVGACVGVRGSRIKNIVDELFGEKIDIVRWNESIELLIMNALKPAEISSMDLDFDTMEAKVYVREDQQSLAIGKRGQNVRLASKLTGWQLDIVPVSAEDLEKLRQGDDLSEEEAAAQEAAAKAAEAKKAGRSPEDAAESAADSAESSEPEAPAEEVDELGLDADDLDELGIAEVPEGLIDDASDDVDDSSDDDEEADSEDDSSEDAAAAEESAADAEDDSETRQEN